MAPKKILLDDRRITLHVNGADYDALKKFYPQVQPAIRQLIHAHAVALTSKVKV